MFMVVFDVPAVSDAGMTSHGIFAILPGYVNISQIRIANFEPYT
jgi:hypothetical protein